MWPCQEWLGRACSMLAKCAPQVKEFTIRASNFKLDPNEIRVKKGDKVKITYVSDDIGHNFYIDDFNVKTKIVSSGGQDVAEFTANKEGTFDYYCNVGSHKSLGMKGNLIVEA